MKIVKKLKGIISWHFYNDDEINSVIETVLAISENRQTDSLPLLTNLFKGTDGDEIADFYIITGQEENRLYIDNEQKKIILNVQVGDLVNFITVMQSFLKDKRTPCKEIIRIMISKKEYSLQGFNQQYKRFIKKDKKKTEEKKEQTKTE